METGSTRRYFLYAIGEITLVVIGILVALQVNNLNETRKTRKIETQYLRALHAEFEQNLREVERVLHLSETMVKSCQRISKWTGQRKMKINEKDVAKEFGKAFQPILKFVPSPGVLNDLISSGNLSQLSSAQLRFLIQQWFVNLQQTKEEENQLSIYRDKTVNLIIEEMAFRKLVNHVGEPWLNEVIDLETSFDVDNTDILQKIEFENALTFNTIVIQSLNQRFYLPLKENINAVLSSIKEQIE